MASSSRVATVLHDADCGFCTRCVRLAEGPLFAARPRFVPLQQFDLAAHGIGHDQAVESMHTVLEDGTVVSGAPAWAHILRRSRAPWPLLGRVMELPGARHLAAAAYRWIADHRTSLPGGTATCAMPTPETTPGTGAGNGDAPVAATQGRPRASARHDAVAPPHPGHGGHLHRRAGTG